MYSIVLQDGSIKNFFKISYFRGEDQMYCDNCDMKTDAAGVSYTFICDFLLCIFNPSFQKWSQK